MCRTLFVFFFICSSFSGIAQTKDPRKDIPLIFPKYEEILTYLDDTITAPCEDCIFSLAKKNEGYFLQIKKYANNQYETVDNIPVWDAKTKKYLPFEIEKYVRPLMKMVDESMPDNGIGALLENSKLYDFFLVYGYPEWSSDLKKILEPKSDLTCKELEMLARVYSDEAGNYIHPNMTGTYFPATFQLTDPLYESISKDRIDEFLTHSKKSLSYYQKIKNIDPSYQPLIIENLDLKIGHDYMHYYSYLSSVKEHSLAKEYLDKVYYSGSIIEYAKSILLACKNNSILFTSGDTDTFPLWYIQEKMGIRKDVVVLNTSVLQTVWYQIMNKEIHQYATGFSKEEYIQAAKLTYLFDKEKEAKNFDQWILQLKDSLTNPSTTALENRYIYLPPISTIQLNNVATKIEFDRYGAYTIMVVILDIINSNKSFNFYTTSTYNLFEIKVYSNAVYRDNSFQLVPDKPDNFQDLETIRLLKERIEKYDLSDYTETSIQGGYQLSNLIFALKNISDKELQKTLYNEFNSKIEYRKLVDHFNLDVLEDLCSLYALLDPKKHKEFKKYYKSIALEKIKNIQIDTENNRKEITNLRYMRSIYKSQSEAKTSKSDKIVLDAICEKIIELIDDEKTKKMKWTRSKLLALKSEC